MDGIEWASSAMEAAQNRLDIATQNLANLSTDGYRKREARGFITARGAAVVPVVSQRPAERSVDQISEMIDVMTAQRAYEGAQKIVSAIDETHKQSNDIARVK